MYTITKRGMAFSADHVDSGRWSYTLLIISQVSNYSTSIPAGKMMTFLLSLYNKLLVIQVF